MGIKEHRKQKQKQLNWQKSKKVIAGVLFAAILGGAILGWNYYRYITEQEKVDTDVHIFDKDGNEIPLNQP